MSTDDYFGPTELGEPITECALALIGEKDDQWHPCGTAIIISKHLALTARHVVDDYWKYYDEDYRLKFGNAAAEFHLFASQVQEGPVGALWNVRNIWTSPHSDLAIIDLHAWSQSATTYKWRSVVINVAPPGLSDVITAFGYEGGATTFDRLATDQLHWTLKPRTTKGRVTSVYPCARDQALLKFPCFETSARFEHGMSGGPVFNSQGKLVGIICSSLKQPDGSWISHATMLWPLLAMSIKINFREAPLQEYSIHELQGRGLFRVVGLDALQISPLPNGHFMFAPRMQADTRVSAS